ncbi:basic proline-rich protein-like [Vulpes lagopus]|uniref:basic proline-rich protein-like n=1 Tax=Vulpes lagopus TaxID=494514 RepID=UPI001BC909A7|nr:basic proline-rich protein-like [Vulpes lagopus]
MRAQLPAAHALPEGQRREEGGRASCGRSEGRRAVHAPPSPAPRRRRHPPSLGTREAARQGLRGTCWSPRFPGPGATWTAVPARSPSGCGRTVRVTSRPVGAGAACALRGRPRRVRTARARLPGSAGAGPRPAGGESLEQRRRGPHAARVDSSGGRCPIPVTASAGELLPGGWRLAPPVPPQGLRSGSCSLGPGTARHPLRASAGELLPGAWHRPSPPQGLRWGAAPWGLAPPVTPLRASAGELLPGGWRLAPPVPPSGPPLRELLPGAWHRPSPPQGLRWGAAPWGLAPPVTPSGPPLGELLPGGWRLAPPVTPSGPPLRELLPGAWHRPSPPQGLRSGSCSLGPGTARHPLRASARGAAPWGLAPPVTPLRASARGAAPWRLAPPVTPSGPPLRELLPGGWHRPSPPQGLRSGSCSLGPGTARHPLRASAAELLPGAWHRLSPPQGLRSGSCSLGPGTARHPLRASARGAAPWGLAPPVTPLRASAGELLPGAWHRPSPPQGLRSGSCSLGPGTARHPLRASARGAAPWGLAPPVTPSGPPLGELLPGAWHRPSPPQGLHSGSCSLGPGTARHPLRASARGAAPRRLAPPVTPSGPPLRELLPGGWHRPSPPQGLRSGSCSLGPGTARHPLRASARGAAPWGLAPPVTPSGPPLGELLPGGWHRPSPPQGLRSGSCSPEAGTACHPLRASTRGAAPWRLAPGGGLGLYPRRRRSAA